MNRYIQLSYPKGGSATTIQFQIFQFSYFQPSKHFLEIDPVSHEVTIFSYFSEGQNLPDLKNIFRDQTQSLTLEKGLESSKVYILQSLRVECV